MSSLHAGIAHQPSGQGALQYLSLEQVEVKAWVVDVSSRIILAQTFYNPSGEPTGRAKYVFPLPANAAVCAFELELEDGTVIMGEVKEKEEAALVHARAIDQGKTTALVERVTDDIFTISVGSIPPTSRVTAHLTFVMDLIDEGLRDHVRLQLPIHVAERYGTPPAELHGASAAASQTRLNIAIDIQTSGIIHDIRSPTHSGIIRRHHKNRAGQKSKRRTLVLWSSSEFLESDFVLAIYAEGLDKPRCFAEVIGAGEYGDGSGSTIALQLGLVPKFFAPKIPSQEYIFVIDRSGSMTNEPIETAKRTLTMLLRLLPSAQTTFNILSFGNEVSGLWSSSRALDPASLSEATTHVVVMSANFGGTDIPKALQKAFSSRGLDRPAVVFLLTDGQISPSDALDPWVIISNAVRNSPSTAPVRLFVLGIGRGVSSDVCRRLAQQGNGEYMFALVAEDIVGKCARLLNAGRSKNIERIEIVWGHAASLSTPQATTLSLPTGTAALAPPPAIQQAPQTLTRIFSGIRFTVFAITTFKTVPASVKLITKLEGESDPQELTVLVTKVKPFYDTDTHSVVPIVHTLAARKLIMELDDGVGPLPKPPPEDALLATEEDLRKAGIVRLGLTYQLVSKHTSFVAVQRGDEQTRSGRGGGRGAWARSRLIQAKTKTSTNSRTSLDGVEGNERDQGGPTFLDRMIEGAVSFFSSVVGFLFGGVASTASNTNMSLRPRPRPRPQHRPAFAGIHGPSSGSSSVMGSDGDQRGHGRSHRSRPRPTPKRRSTSRQSADNSSIDTLSSLDGSTSCSDCWTTSRSLSPRPRFPEQDPIDRPPSPSFIQEKHHTNANGNHAGPNPDRVKRVPISQDVYDLFYQMDIDGSFSTSPLLVQLVGQAVLIHVPENGQSASGGGKAWTTAVVVAYLRTRLEGEPDLLELVTDKAKEFVEAYGEGGFERMVREATRLLSASGNGDAPTTLGIVA